MSTLCGISDADEATLLKTAQSELASLSRVSHRIAMIDTTARLAAVLDKLLPRLLKRIGDNRRNKQQHERHQQQQPNALAAVYDQIHAKLVEILSHVMKRVRHDAACKLPCVDILDLFLENSSNDNEVPLKMNEHAENPVTMHLALTFLTTGLPRSSRAELYRMLPRLLACQMLRLETTASKSQSYQLAHLLLRCMEGLVTVSSTSSSKLNDEPLFLPDQGDGDATSTATEDPLRTAKRILQANTTIAETVFDLLLDVLLYQPTPASSTLPPPGLSQTGLERLHQGNSVQERDWAAEMAPRKRLSQLKWAVLEFVAPCRRWNIFLAEASTGITRDMSMARERLGLARTIALLVAATGDNNVEVVERAKSFLKLHMDSFRESGGGSSMDLRTSHANDGSVPVTTTAAAGGTAVDQKKENASRTLFGDPAALMCSLFSLCLGQTHAESALTSSNVSHLGRVLEQSSSINLSTQVILSTKRRAVSESTLAALLSFVASKILEDDPHLMTEELSTESSSETALQSICFVAVQVANRTLLTTTTLSVSGLSELRAKPYSSAARLLNALAMRLATFYDTLFVRSMNDGNNGLQQKQQAQLTKVMAQMISTACSVLVPASTQRLSTGRGATTAAAVVNDGNLTIRDYCYGVICTLARCQFATLPEGYIFSRGEATKSISTPTLLFGCAANEEERLRPRAVAALDALLGGYVRLYTRQADHVEEMESIESSPRTQSNPWLQQTPPEPKERETVTTPTSQAGLLSALLPLVWTAAQCHKPKASRVAAARWSCELLKELEIASACHLLCFLSGDTDPTACSIAREGLGVANLSDSMESSLSKLPDFGIFVSFVFGKDSTSSLAPPTQYQHFSDFSFKGKATTLRFGMICLLSDLYGGTKDSVEIYLASLRQTLAVFKTGTAAGETAKAVTAVELLDECSSCLLSLLSASQYARREFSRNDSVFGFTDLKALAFHANSSRARRQFAAACGVLFQEDSQTWVLNGADFFDEVVCVFDQGCETLRGIDNGPVAMSSLHGAVFLCAQAVKTVRLRSRSWDDDARAHHCWERSAEVLHFLGLGTLHKEELIGNACADGIAIALSYDDNDAQPLSPLLTSASIDILRKLDAANRKFSHTDTMNASRLTKVAVATGVSLASTAAASPCVGNEGMAVELGTNRLACVDALFGLLGSAVNRKEEEIALIAGEALACYADAYCPTIDVWTSPQSTWPVEYDESYANTLPPHEHVLYKLLRSTFASSSPQKRTSTSPALLAITARAARGVTSSASYASRAYVRSILSHLDEIQATFIALLSDPKSKHLSRESCCLGLASCRGLLLKSSGDGSETMVHDLNSRLLRAFGQTTVFAGSAMQETSAQANERRITAGPTEARHENLVDNAMEVDGEIGGASGISEAALGAYREMASASVSLGRPDILYALLILSVSHTYWFTEDARHQYSASAILGDCSFGNSIEMKNALRPHLGKLIPRILRAKHDPNRQTRDQMSSLWAGITGGGADSRLAVSLHLLTTVDALIEETSSKLWRVRVGSCGALAEIIVGRDWEAFGGGGAVLNDDFMYTKVTSCAGVRLLRLWRASMRALDDVRGAVRDSGGVLARAVRGLTISLCDPSSTEESQTKRGKGGFAVHALDTGAAAATSLRWLVRHGLNQHADGVAICTTTLVEVVSLVTPSILEPILPDIIKSLLLAVSALEPSVLNYLQLRTSDQDGLERVRLQAAQSGPIAAAVSKCLDLTPGASTETQHKVVIELDAALRQSPGFATRAATADAVAKLCSSCPQAFRFSTSGNSNPSVRLLRAFYHASEQERTSASRDRLIHALGGLAAHCPGSSVRSLAVKSCVKYRSSTGNNDDPVTRLAAAAALRSIAVRASNQITGEYADAWRNRVLPVAFVGRKDTEQKIAALWQDVWEEAGTASRSSESPTYGTTQEENLLEPVCRECITALEDVSWARRVAACQALIELCDLGVLGPIRGTNPSAVDDVLVRMKRRARCCHAVLESCLLLLKKPRLWEGKIEAVKATTKVAAAWIRVQASEDNDCIEISEVERYIPLLLAASSPDDLLVGDGWFQAESKQIEESLGYDEEQQQKSDIEISTQDSLLVSEDITDLEEYDADTESAISVSGGQSVSFKGFCRLLLEQALATSQRDTQDLLLPYRKVCLDSLSSLLTHLPRDQAALGGELYDFIAPKLFQLIRSVKEPPVLTAASLFSIGSVFWFGIGEKRDESAELQKLALRISELGGSKQPAWSVREASAKCFSQLVPKMHVSCFRQHALISCIVDSATHALKDRKFWRVRYAGLSLLQSLVQRAGDSTATQKQEERDILEALLPHKENIVAQLRACLQDPEAKMTALSTDLLSAMEWWP